MAFFLENYGLAELSESEEAVQGLMRQVAQEGSPIAGYYNEPYFNLHYGDVQMVLRTEKMVDGGGLHVTGIDAHVAGDAIWEARILEGNINSKDADHLSKRILIGRKDGSGGLSVVNLVNADVLPCFAKDEPIKMQMAAYPAEINYFLDEEEYANSQTKGNRGNGELLLLRDGLVVATGFLHNHNPDNSDFEQNNDLDSYVLLRGTVKKLRQGIFELGGEEFKSFIRCLIGTEFGDLELLHTIDAVAQEQRKNIHTGAIVSAVCVLSGDVAIDEYEKGVILDEAHNLSLLRGVFNGEDPERMRSALNENAEYISEYSGNTYTGIDAIIERFKFVQRETKAKRTYSAFYATICSKDVGASGKRQRAIALSRDMGQSFESVAVIETDECGKIARLTVSDGSEKYDIAIDTLPIQSSLVDKIDLPKSVVEPMLNRARFKRIISEDITDDEVMNGGNSIWKFEDCSKKMFDSLLSADYSDEVLANVFGYLFAKAIEGEYQDRHHMVSNQRYEPMDAFSGILRTSLDPTTEEKIADTIDVGKVFFKDFKFFQENIEQFNIEKNLPLAFFAVQQLGRVYYDQLFA